MKNYLLIILICLIFFHENNVFAEEFNKNTLLETVGLVSAGKKPIVLLGKQINIGQQAPDFKVVNEKFVPVTLENFAGKIIVISVVPSLDTGVCSLQTKRFNEEVANIPDDVIILTISNDLPFAQKRYCQQEKIDQLQVLSDSVWREFGYNYGLLIKDMGLLTRAVFIIDKQGIVQYKELVADISAHPNYQQALQALAGLTNENAIKNDVTLVN